MIVLMGDHREGVDGSHGGVSGGFSGHIEATFRVWWSPRRPLAWRTAPRDQVACFQSSTFLNSRSISVMTQQKSLVASVCRFTIAGSLAVAVAWSAGSASASGPLSNTPSNPSGVWRGEWSSGSTGHRGALGARIRPAGPDRYQALFYGRFAGVIPFAYRTTLDRVPGTADVYTSAKKMPLLGTYRTTATISGGSFHADFAGRRDRGVFTMTRRR